MAIFPGASSFQSCESWRMVDWQGMGWCDAKAGMENKRSLSLSLLRIIQCRNKTPSKLRAIVCLPRNLLPPRSSRSSMSEEGEFLKTSGLFVLIFYSHVIRCHVRIAYQCLVQNGTNKDDSTLTALLTEETRLRWLLDSHKLWSRVT